MIPAPPPEDTADDLPADQLQVDIDEDEPDEDPELGNDDVDEWPDPEGWAFYVDFPDDWDPF